MPYWAGCGARLLAPAAPEWVGRRFPKEIALFQNGDDCFLSLIGEDGQLDLPRSDVENGVCRVALDKNVLACAAFDNRSSAVGFCQKDFDIETRFGPLFGPMCYSSPSIRRVVQLDGLCKGFIRKGFCGSVGSW